jgi:ArsR family transcriptional regulator
MLELLKDHYRRAIGIDASREMIAVARAKLSAAGIVHAQARRALKPGGEMLIVDFAPHELEFLRAEHAHRRLGLSEAQMSGWARAAGLGVTDLTTFPAATAEGLTVCLWRLKDEQDSR